MGFQFKGARAQVGAFLALQHGGLAWEDALFGRLPPVGPQAVAHTRSHEMHIV